ncbi:Hypothetical protein POVR1_LOCUS161 [uncultured virus]|nr:Hypothetical protein POVR1_LOCUS161 [uncultured virus]
MMSRGESLTIDQVKLFEQLVLHEIIQPFELLTHIQKVKIDIWYRALDIFSDLIDRTETRLQMVVQANARALTEQSQSLPTSYPTETDQSENLLMTELEPEEPILISKFLQVSTKVESARYLTSTPIIKESSMETTHEMRQSHDLTYIPRMFHPKHSKHKGNILSTRHSLVWFHPKHSKYKDYKMTYHHSLVWFHPKHSKRKDCLPTTVTLSFHPKHSKHRHRYY